MESACDLVSAFFWFIFATAYSIPEKKPTPIADTEPVVTGSPKNIIPEAATGSLFSAPTILIFGLVLTLRTAELHSTHLYVVLLVTRTHHAVVYEIPTAAAPENAMASNNAFRVVGGLSRYQ